MVQRRAARFVKSKYKRTESVTAMLNELGWHSLSKRREDARLILFYKIINNWIGLQEVSDAKYLGIQIDNKLDWNKHISTVAARGQSKLAFLNRNLKGCPKKLRDTAYISLIRPALEYSCSVWHPHKKSNKDKIEKVQRRAARFVSNNFRRKASVSEMLGWQSRLAIP